MISARLNRVSSPARRGHNWSRSVGKTGNSGGRRIFQAGATALCKGAAVSERFQLIRQLSDRFSLAWLRRQLGVARSGFYAWRQRQQNPGPQPLEKVALMAQVEAVFQRHPGFYGSPRIHQEFRASGLKVGRHRAARLMRTAAFKMTSRRVFRPCRNSAGKPSGVAENLLLQELSPGAPKCCWDGDITYNRTTAGWRYLATWIGLYSHRVVGLAMDATMETTLVLEALNRAVGNRQIELDQLLIYTDQKASAGPRPIGSCLKSERSPAACRPRAAAVKTP